MPDAVIIVGNDRHFSQRAEMLREYLRDRCRMHVVCVIPTWDRSPEELELPLMYRICSARARPLLVAYMGHGAPAGARGNEYGWGFGAWRGAGLVLPYRRIRTLLRHREGPTLVLNDCCHSGALADMLAARRPVKMPFGVIAASASDGYSYGELTSSVLDAWTRGQPYVPKIRPRTRRFGKTRDIREYVVEETRWGAELDHLFFPKPD